MHGLLEKPIKAILSSATVPGFGWKQDTWPGVLDWTESSVPSGFDYDMWLGPRPYKPFHTMRTHWQYRRFWDYDGGGLGDMGQHQLAAHVADGIDARHVGLHRFVDGDKAPLVKHNTRVFQAIALDPGLDADGLQDLLSFQHFLFAVGRGDGDFHAAC